MSDLTPKQRLFVEEYLKDMNATQAAIRAGYSKKTAEQQGYQLLKKTSVAKAVTESMDQRVAEVKYGATELLEDMKELFVAAKEAALLTKEPSALTAAKGIGDSIGKHVDVQAWKDRVEVDMKTDHASMMEDAMRRVEGADRTKRLKDDD